MQATHPRRTYDHRIQQAICETGNRDLFPEPRALLEFAHRGILALFEERMDLPALAPEYWGSSSPRGFLREAAQRGDAPRGLRWSDAGRDVLRDGG